MHRTITFLLALILISLISGCVTGGYVSPRTSVNGDTVGEPNRPEPMPPAGMRLGAQYVSGLNEPCYELYPADGALAQPQALCMRKGNWEVVPAIFMIVPSGAVSY